MADDDMDVPPLEDMSDVLHKILSSSVKIDNSTDSRRPGMASSGSLKSDSSTAHGRASSLVSGIS